MKSIASHYHKKNNNKLITFKLLFLEITSKISRDLYIDTYF